MIDFKQPTVHVSSIQLLRGFAAWLVVFHHYNQAFFSWDMSNSILGDTFGEFIKVYGKLGVDIFFVISGFIIFLSADRNINVKKFLVNRVCRVVPTYWFYTFVLLMLTFFIPESVSSDWNVKSLIQSLFFIYNENPSPALGAFPLLSVGWTLNFEMFFYIICAGSMLIFNKRWYAPVVLLLLFSNSLWMTDYLSYFFNSKYIREFAFGILIGIAFKRGLIPDSNKLGLLLLMLSIVFFFLKGTESNKTCAIVLLVISFLTFKISVFDNKVSCFIKHLGDLSYSTYLIHAAISIPLCLTFFSKDTSGGIDYEWLLFLVYILGTYVMSYFSFKYIENNILTRSIKRKYLQTA